MGATRIELKSSVRGRLNRSSAAIYERAGGGGSKTRGQAVLVVGVAVLHPNEVDDGKGGAEENDLHDGVVEGGEVPEDVEVACHKHQRIHFLRLERDACTIVAKEMRAELLD